MRDFKLFPPIKPDHAAAIGYVAAHWSMVEQQLAFIIYEMLHLHTILGWATTAELTTLRRINTISAFVESHRGKGLDRRLGRYRRDLR